ncbi:MAG TPA: UDP-N-acetylglucosamine pyrophosphorylase [Clostridiales bacterium]|nr:UDP-N-acetylglucosamine pyrophosphorylase [Clostridiales bacterium]
MFEQLKVENLLDINQTIAKELFENIQYPWQALSKISEFIMAVGPTLPEEKYDKIGRDIWVAKSANVAPSAFLNGPLIICERAEVRHCAFIRGKAIVGEGCVVGNSTELKGSILFNCVQVPHYNYVGDSILGYKAHTGAGTITSNLKSDKHKISISVAGDKLDTGLKKLGAIIGDNVEVGCNSVLNPGSIIGRNSNIYPLSMVRGFVPKDSIYKQAGEVVDKR